MGVAKVVEDRLYSPDITRKYVVADLITGWGVAESVLHYYRLYGGQIAGKRVIVQGWGNVGSAAAYYLAQAGARVVGIIDREGGLLNPDGFSLEQVRQLFLEKKGNQLSASTCSASTKSTAHLERGRRGLPAVRRFAALTQAQVDALSRAVSKSWPAANVPFADREIFYGPIYEKADAQVAVIPDSSPIAAWRAPSRS
jgi:glutamate dehydrogenase (NAD(P)+)